MENLDREAAITAEMHLILNNDHPNAPYKAVSAYITRHATIEELHTIQKRINGIIKVKIL